MKYLDISISILVIGIIIISVINYLKKIKETFEVINKCSELAKCKKIKLPKLQETIVTEKPTTTTKAIKKTDEKKETCNECLFPHYNISMIAQNNICKAYKDPKNYKNLGNHISFKECGKKTIYDTECGDYFNYIEKEGLCYCKKKDSKNDNCVEKKYHPGGYLAKVEYVDPFKKESNDILCMVGSNFKNKCSGENQLISNPCGNIVCKGDNWCKDATLQKSKNIICRGKNTCQNTTIKKAKTLTCSGKNSCLNSKISNIDTLFCRGENSCKDADISNVNTVICEGKGENTCRNVKLTNVKEIRCNGGKNVCYGAEHKNKNNKYAIYCSKKNNSCEQMWCNNSLLDNVEKGKYLRNCPF